MINHGAISNGSSIGSISVFQFEGKICFYIPRLSYWQGYSVRFTNVAGAGNGENEVASITNAVKPTNISKNYDITIKDSFHTGHFPTWSEIADKPSTMTPSVHTHDDRYFTESEVTTKLETKVNTTGSSLTGDLTFTTDHGVHWSRNTDGASITFENISDADTDSYMHFKTIDNGNEYFKFTSMSATVATDLFTIKSDNARFKTYQLYHEGHKPTWSEVDGKPSSFTPASHTHDDRYFTESEINTKLARTITHPESLGTRNLNDITAKGHYYQSANVNTPGKNYPEEQAGALTVKDAAGIVQEYHIYGSNKVYTRAKYTTEWTNWKAQAVLEPDGELYIHGHRVYHGNHKPTTTDIGALDRGSYSIIGQDMKIHGKRAMVGMSSGELYLGYGADFHSITLNPATTYTKRCYSDNWFYSTGNTGWHNSTHGGGWYMTDGTWMRSYSNKNVYTGGVMKADSGFEGGGLKIPHSSSEKYMSYNYNNTGKGWGNFFNNNGMGWYDWHSNRNILDYEINNNRLITYRLLRAAGGIQNNTRNFKSYVELTDSQDKVRIQRSGNYSLDSYDIATSKEGDFIIDNSEVSINAINSRRIDSQAGYNVDKKEYVDGTIIETDLTKLLISLVSEVKTLKDEIKDLKNMS